MELLPERALHWPEAGVLAVADLHGGKTESFQQHSIPLPSGVLDDDLTRLSAALDATRARRLLLVGDLFHSRQGLTQDVIRRVTTWREAHPHLDVVLIRGNHDRHVRALPPHLEHGGPRGRAGRRPFRFPHHPEPAAGRFVWAGHLHPMVKLDGGADRLRLPCFHLRPGVGVLPAFSAFTGGLNVRQGRGDRIFAIAGTWVVEV